MLKLILAACLALVAAFGVGVGWAQTRRAPPPPPPPDMNVMLQNAQNFTVKVRSTVTWPIEGERFGSAQGTGFVIDKARGWVLTNAHVARSSPGAVDIAFGDSEDDWTPAERVYVDNLLDIAVIKLAADRAPATMTEAKLGCGRAVPQGAPVVAYGHPRDLNFTATRGIVSSVRTLGPLEFIQMDASVNPGNSGGALLALDHAEVIGVTTATAGNGLGFATPMRHVCPILDLLRKDQDPTVPTLPVYWLKAGNADSLTVAELFPNVPAGFPLQRGDTIVGMVGGPRFEELPDLLTALRGRSDAVDLIVRRNGAETTVRAPVLAATPRLSRQAVAVSGMVIDDDRFVDAEASILPRLHIDYLRQGETGERAGFRVGDSLAEIDGKTFNSVAELHAWLKDKPQGASVPILVRRWRISPSGVSTEFLRLTLRVEDAKLITGGA